MSTLRDQLITKIDEYISQTEEHANGIIPDAIKKSDDIINDAKKKSDDIINDAKKKSDDIINDAKKKSDDIINDAKKKSDDMHNKQAELKKKFEIELKTIEHECEKEIKILKDKLEQIKKNFGDTKDSSIITLNVGGRLFITTTFTLTQEDSMLKAMISGKYKILKDKDDNIFIDRDPDLFKQVLHYLRTDYYPTTENRNEFKNELDYYSIYHDLK